MVAKLQHYSGLTISEACSEQNGKKFKIYEYFPKNSDFKNPFSEDKYWASIHIQGKPCLIGYMKGNIFYVVFLDKEHRFYITTKKHT